MSSLYQSFIKHSEICCLLVLAVFLDLSTSTRVQVSYSNIRTEGHGMPDELDVTVRDESGTHNHLHLKRTPSGNPNVPVITLNVDQDGQIKYKREILEDNQDIGYYRDENRRASLEVTRVEEFGGKDSNFLLKGELNIGGTNYWLNPDRSAKRDAMAHPNHEYYTLVARESRPGDLHDLIEATPEVKRTIVETVQRNIPERSSILEEQDISPLSASSSHSRRESYPSTRQDIYIDVAAFADYSVYDRFLKTSKNRANCLKAIREYYAFNLIGVNLRYQGITNIKYNIHVVLNKIIVAESPEASTFTESIRQRNVELDQVDANKALSAFRDFVNGPGKSAVGQYDHVMIFTAYDLTSLKYGSFSNSVAGLAYESALCRTDGASVSILEDRGGYQCVDTAAHELGHSLSAQHDEDGNLCKASVSNIMSALLAGSKLASWEFSSCSIKSFTSFIDKLLQTPEGKTCLLQQLPIDAEVPEMGDRLPGQEVSADDQCRMMYGNASCVCRDKKFVTDICTAMSCSVPNTNLCNQHRAARGTSCGNGKLCLVGRCVADYRAPKVDDTCLFGDQPGIAFFGKTCPQLIAENSAYCDQSAAKAKCCASCKDATKKKPDPYAFLMQER